MKTINLISVNENIDKYKLDRVLEFETHDEFRGHAVSPFIAMINKETGEILKTGNNDKAVIEQILKDDKLKLFKRRTTITTKDSEGNKQLTAVEMIHMPYVVENHISLLPTVSDKTIDTNRDYFDHDFSYNVKIEILFVRPFADPDEPVYKYYAVLDVTTTNMSVWDILESVFEDPSEKEYKALFVSKPGQKRCTMRFYDDTGNYVDENFKDTNEIKNYINSVRIVGLEAFERKDDDCEY